MPAWKEQIQNKILYPIRHNIKKVFGKAAISEACKHVAAFIYEKSADTAFILLALNAISTISSHLAQIGGLKKNKRENSDYLITQEWQELGLDIIFTIIPPFILKNFLSKKLDSGEWTTRSARDKLLNIIAPTVGASPDNFYGTDHIVSAKETFGGLLAKILNKVKKIENLPQPIKKMIKTLEKNRYITMPDPNKKIVLAKMEKVTADFDSIRNNIFKGFHNGSAFDEICGQNSGIVIMASIAYTVIASAIITPIIKNKLSNIRYKKKLEKQQMQESKKSMKFDMSLNRNDNNVFEIFSNVDNTISIRPKDSLPPVKKEIKRNAFDSFNTFSKLTSQSSSLRI